MNKGYLLVVDGLGGSGKSTLCDKIQNWFDNALIPCVRTFEPGGTPAANFLRKLCREGIPDAEKLTPMAEALLFNAARAQHVETVIKPALERGEVVLCDRYLLSTLGYQGIGRGLSIYTLEKIHHDAIGLLPDMTIVMEGDPEVFMRRVTPVEKQSDQFDNWNKELYNRIQFFFERTANENPDTYMTVDAEQSADQVFAQVLPLLMRIQNNRAKQPSTDYVFGSVGSKVINTAEDGKSYEVTYPIVDAGSVKEITPSITCPPVVYHGAGGEVVVKKEARPRVVCTGTRDEVVVKGESVFHSIVPGRMENKGINDTSVKESCYGCGNECASKKSGGADQGCNNGCQATQS